MLWLADSVRPRFAMQHLNDTGSYPLELIHMDEDLSVA